MSGGVAAAAAPMRRWPAALSIAAALAATSAVAASPHTHGEATLDVAVEGDGFSVSLRVPVEALVGFEHRPRTDGQRKAARDALAVLQAPANWLRPDESAGCTADAAGVDADTLRPAPAVVGDARAGGAPGGPAPVAPAPRGQPAPPRTGGATGARALPADVDHADAVVDVRWRCRRPAALGALDLGPLFDAFPRLQRVTTQLAGPRGQAARSLTRTARRLVLAR